jgi:hypothetical protein
MVAEDTFEGGREALEIEQRLVDIEDDDGESGHRGLHLMVSFQTVAAATASRMTSTTGFGAVTSGV